MNLEVRNAVFYNGRFPSVREPSEIGSFSLDSNRQYCDDSHQLKYLVTPPVTSSLNMDLNRGYAEAHKKDFSRTEKINTLLTWILRHQDKVRNNFPVQKNGARVDFVCFRGLLTCLCTTVYENKDDWIICASRFRSTIYLCAYDTASEIARRANATERDRLMSSWGYKFEQYMSASSPHGKPDPQTPCDECSEYNVVLKGRLNTHTLLFSAEVDGITTAGTYGELKTSRLIGSEKQYRNFCRYKLIKWWIQSFLCGCPEVVCGFRDDEGIVRKLETFRVRDMPRIAEGLWSPSACLNFCCHFLDHVKRCVVKDDPNVVYQFHWIPGQDIVCKELSPPNEYQFLPQWFVENVRL